MIDEDDRNYASDDDAYDAAPLLTKNYGSCANASRLRLDPPSSKRRRSFAQRRRYFCLVYGCGLALLVGGVLDVIFRIGPYRGKPKWRRRGYRRATHTPTAAPTPPAKHDRRDRRGDGVTAATRDRRDRRRDEVRDGGVS